jgi:hypothetical protein
MTLQALTQEFEMVEPVTVDRTDAGRVTLQMPQSRYGKADEKAVHQHGWGPFCEFDTVARDTWNTAGVFAITVDYDVVYVGESTNVGRLIRTTYGSISPGACFDGGQVTACRVNHAICEALRNNRQVAIWFAPSEDRKAKKSELSTQFNPDWQ